MFVFTVFVERLAAWWRLSKLLQIHFSSSNNSNWTASITLAVTASRRPRRRYAKSSITTALPWRRQTTLTIKSVLCWSRARHLALPTDITSPTAITATITSRPPTRQCQTIRPGILTAASAIVSLTWPVPWGANNNRNTLQTTDNNNWRLWGNAEVLADSNHLTARLPFTVKLFRSSNKAGNLGDNCGFINFVDYFLWLFCLLFANSQIARPWSTDILTHTNENL